MVNVSTCIFSTTALAGDAAGEQVFVVGEALVPEVDGVEEPPANEAGVTGTPVRAVRAVGVLVRVLTCA